MTDIQLTKHFRLSEFTRSETAEKYSIDNSLDPNNPLHAEIIANLKNLCEQVLEPLRDHFGVPIIISSGYRCPALNSHPEVRGASTSQHMLGQAADIYIPKYNFVDSQGKSHSNLEILTKWMHWLIDNTDFDHCIKETANRRTYWIHISCLRNRKQNRHKVTSFLLKS